MITELPNTRTTRKAELLKRYVYIRELTEKLCQPLEKEDCVVQPIVNVSPPKWHLGHTTWFFETFILLNQPGYKVYHENFSYIFNSYYETVGKRVIRANRGNLSRPTVDEIYAYRKYVDEHMVDFFDAHDEIDDDLNYTIEVGINHEQQHQELLIVDTKYIFGHNPIFPAYSECNGLLDHPQIPELKFESVEGGVYEIGHDGKGFCYDNERDKHKVYINDFNIANRVVSNAEFLEFIQTGGYQDFNYWLSEGWDWVNSHGIKCPLYWHFYEGEWYEYTLKGFQRLNLYAPVTHISYFEADAYAGWRRMRLPTEEEWEIACQNLQHESQNALYIESNCFHPDFRIDDSQFLGNSWEWTSGDYSAYPGFKKAPGALGEYNGKFMINQKVLRGGSVATPDNHMRISYRNFFHPHLRWQFTGIRLVK